MIEEEKQNLNFGTKRIKISEQSEISYPLYDEGDLETYTSELDKISLVLDNQKKIRFVSKSPKDISKSGLFYNLAKELRSLARLYHLKIEEINSMFMDVSCDMGLLKQALDGKKVGWTNLEDIYIWKGPGTIEFDYLCKERGEEEVRKRMIFLEELKDP